MVRWGIIGAGRIAHRFCESLKHFDDCELYAVSCRTQEKADAFKQQYNAKIAYAGFDNIVNDSNIDCVYVATPHQFHKEWIIKCLKSHKAVLCEKPACMNAEEMKEVIVCAKENNTLFMEAMKTRFVPLYQDIKKRIINGDIGEIQLIETSLCNDIDLDMIKGSYLLDPSSGGVLTDTGIYCVSWIEDYLKGKFIVQDVEKNIQNNVNLYTKANIQFSEVSAVVECAMDRSKDRDAIIHGTKGMIIVKNLHRPQYAIVKTDDIEDLHIPYEVDDFYSQIKEFNQLLKQNKIESSIMPFESSLRCAQMIDAISSYKGK